MQRPHARLAVLAAVVATVALASCQGESPTEAIRERSLFAANDASSGDSLPGDSIPGDTTPPDTIPPDTIPPDTIPPDTIPPDTIPPDTTPPPPTVTVFDLTVTVVGAADSSGDTTQVARLQGARVTLFRYDSLPDSTSVPNAVIGDRPTNHSGVVAFQNLKPAWYRVDVQPPRDSPFLPASRLVAPATSEDVPLQVLLLRAP